MEKLRYATGIDLGGTFVKYALVAETGEIVLEGKLPVGGKASREDTLEAIRASIEKTVGKANEEGVQIAGIGIGSPGIICEGVVQGGADNLDRWFDIDLAGIFGNAFHLPVFADNDANVMGLGEATYGAAKDCSDVIFITVGTGIGGAIIANGELYGGYKNRGTEMGHVTIHHKGIPCNCGGRGCLEAYASTSALVQQYAEAAGLNAEEVNGHLIVEKYKNNEATAVKCMQEHTDYLGHGIAGFINTFAPQKVVIGGGISEAGQFYIDMIKESAFSYAMADCAVNTDVVGATLGNNAGCLGAASLVFKHVK
ncbi:ROK family protein [Maribellus sp. YY47]|uniref:ROK family protein n=1 Tax=Maribellus sp. YY47 TaxID=2929486 RepID=UPI002000F098|nr:ROK family protein [Maribellus sp. YY47]MCK3682843.1 ROK family protein [Maribellus sp. YY47]